MRPRTRNERMLSIAVGTCVFLLANLFGVRWVANEMRTWRRNITRLQGEVATARQVVQEAPYWHARQDWMNAHPLPAYDENQSLATLMQDLPAGIKRHNLKIEGQQPVGTEVNGSLAVVEIDFKLEGRLEDIVRWLHSIQQPGQYFIVRNFVLKQTQGRNTMNLDIRLGRVFRTGDIASSP